MDDSYLVDDMSAKCEVHVCTAMYCYACYSIYSMHGMLALFSLTFIAAKKIDTYTPALTMCVYMWLSAGAMPETRSQGRVSSTSILATKQAPG